MKKSVILVGIAVVVMGVLLVGNYIGYKLNDKDVVALIDKSQVDENIDTSFITNGLYREIVINNGINYLNAGSGDNVEFIEYVNEFDYPVNISMKNVNIYCTANGKDEVLANKNMKIDVKFAKNLGGKKTNSLDIASKESAYIYISPKYVGEKLPTTTVNCSYAININVE